jgi:hypothetical protein
LKRIRRPHIWGGWSQFGTNRGKSAVSPGNSAVPTC